MNKLKIYTKTKLSLLALTVIGGFIACSPNENGYRNESNVDSSLLPVVSFTASATDIEPGESITFNDTSINSPGLWLWEFQGGNPTSSSEKSPTVTYESGGEYNITLTVRNQYGADKKVFEKNIKVVAPPIIDIDTKAQIRYTFEDNLNSDLEKGLQNVTATSSGAALYDIRPGGGGAYVCSATNPLIIPGYKGINGAGLRSVALWINTPTPALAGLVHWGASGTFSRSSFKLNATTGTIRLEYQGGGHNGVTNVADGTWHHVAYTYDGSAIKLYVDGVEDFTISGIVLRTGEAGETEVNIGSQLGGSIFNGTMDDVRIFDVVLTPAEVLVLSKMK